MNRVVTTCTEHAACVLVTQEGKEHHLPGTPRTGDAHVLGKRRRRRAAEELDAKTYEVLGAADRARIAAARAAREIRKTHLAIEERAAEAERLLTLTDTRMAAAVESLRRNCEARVAELHETADRVYAEGGEAAKRLNADAKLYAQRLGEVRASVIEEVERLDREIARIEMLRQKQLVA